MSFHHFSFFPKFYEGFGSSVFPLYKLTTGASGRVSSLSNVASVVFTSSIGSVGKWTFTYNAGETMFSIDEDNEIKFCN